jgi:hypothetical protein
MSARLFITPTQFWAMAKVTDRHGMLAVAAQDAGHVPALLDPPGQAGAGVALQLDPPGRVAGWASTAPDMDTACGFPLLRPS